MQRVQQIFDTIVVLENVGAVATLRAVIWLQSQAHHRSDHDAILRVTVFATLCSFVALILGCFSLVILRALKKRGAEDLSGRKMWAYISLLASVVLILLSFFLPGEVG
jgi:amino acid transporter